MARRRIPRWLARAPITLYRHGLGRFLGRRLMMLEHRGRRSGLARYVVLEVVDRAPGVLFLASGYGRDSQWFRNVRADPDVRVWNGPDRGVRARATVLTGDEVRRRLESYRQRHRRAAAALGRTLGIPELVGAGPLPADVDRRLPLVRLDLDGPGDAR
ncbi:nitroreductase family deazaflavin-dependent oxidoreductase [Micromonospora halotolerans]|uniref:Nitroreductase family deazaflavin-dependent oxidoreductase n=1 Tax=Micromonospora halotolerans TaxID=709879 RepID=A0ABZ0A2R9_9ACTN|nr:nitroreductase family deazaflavin-dependent oxidoreductase [Micromonospora halotolerans]WNM41722.1 nitroreductase family deazaflavin-dependent oxidoreductase [Micromonospora halotolerans]